MAGAAGILRGFLGGAACFSLLFAGACASSPQARPAVAAPSSAPEAEAASAAVVPPLTSEQQALRAELEGYVNHLSTRLGERSLGRPWELADAADYVASQWEQMGYSLERQGYDVGDVVAQNLEVSVSGSDLGRESIIIGAHYDSPPAGTGVDAATGVAALLAVARALHDSTPRRRLRFVAYALGEPPHFRSESMGSLRHAREIVARGDTVTAMINLDSLGYFSDAPGSQRNVQGIDVPLPDVGNFLLLLGSAASESIGRTLSASCDAQPQLEFVLRSYAGDGDPPLAADDWPYRQSGLPAVVISDTKMLRLDGAERAAAAVDWPRLTRFVSCLTLGIERLANLPREPGDATEEPESR